MRITEQHLGRTYQMITGDRFTLIAIDPDDQMVTLRPCGGSDESQQAPLALFTEGLEAGAITESVLRVGTVPRVYADYSNAGASLDPIDQLIGILNAQAAGPRGGVR